MEDYLEHLNDAQREAVSTTDGPVLVIAGAGSGKTRVIEYRVAHLVRGGADPRSILLLTFTRKAAHEMISRAARHAAGAAHVDGGTFHSFAYKILRHFGERLGLPKTLTVLDEGDAEEVLQRTGVSLGFYTDGRRTSPPDGSAGARARGEQERFPKKSTVRSIVSAVMNKNSTVEDVLLRDYAHFSHLAAEIEQMRVAYAKYKRERGYLDYDDLLVCLRDLLRDEHVRRALGERYRYVMVDEYQDTNHVQGEITHLLGTLSGNILVVGDDAQSIYGFRGASHENIMQFPKDFPGTKIVTLDHNYRSTQRVLDVANAALQTMTDKYSKRLRAAQTHGSSDAPPAFLVFDNPYEEARWLVGRTRALLEQAVPISEQAVLFRSSHVSIPLQAELARRGVPYRIFGGVRFYEMAHVKDVAAHLKFLLSPHDELAAGRALSLLPGIGPRTADALIESFRQYRTLREIAEQGLGGSDRFRRLRELLFHADGVGVGEAVEHVLTYYEPILREQFDDWQKRLPDLQVLRDLAAEYGTLEEFLADLTIDPAVSRGDESRDFLTLSTIHSAKGLEWDAVFFIGQADGSLPSTFALGRDDELEEERRLFYVGITRARRHLALTTHLNSGRGGGPRELSRFVTEPAVLATLQQKFLGGNSFREPSVAYGAPVRPKFRRGGAAGGFYRGAIDRW